MQLNWSFQRGVRGGKYGYYVLISVSLDVCLLSSSRTGASHDIFFTPLLNNIVIVVDLWVYLFAVDLPTLLLNSFSQ